MISHKHKCIFIHIPKCAGTSIEEALGHNPLQLNKSSQDHRSLRLIEEPLAPIYTIKNIENFKEALRRQRYKNRVHKNPNNAFHVNASQFAEYYKFTFVRNPWARAYSWFKNIKRDSAHKNYRKYGDLNFTEFLKHFAGKGKLRPQTYWLKNFKGKIELDFIGKFENLNNDFQHVANKLKLENMKLPHKLKTSSQSYQEYYDKESIKLVGDIYSEEIKIFDYNFDNG